MWLADRLSSRVVLLSLVLGIGLAAYIPKIASAALIFSAIACAFCLKQEQWFEKKTRFIWISFSAPILAILIASSLREEFSARDFDSASRILLGIPIFLYLLRQPYDIKRVVRSSILIALFLGIFFIDPEKTSFYGGRYSTAYSDVNSLGAILVFFLIVCFYILFFERLSVKRTLSFLTAVCCGAYVLLHTGARGPILVLIFVLLVIIVCSARRGSASSLQRRASIFTIVIMPIILLFINPGLKSRIHSISIEISHILRADHKTDTSSGIRVSMLRLSSYLFIERPITGWGDLRNANNMNQSIPDHVAPPHVVEATRLGGPHNELAARAVESGIWGLIGYGLLHFLPLYVLFRKRGKNMVVGDAANQALVCMGTLFLLGFTLETFSLKYMVSLNTILMAIFLSEACKEKYAA